MKSDITNNPTHPLVRCVDGVYGDPEDGDWMCADEPGVGAPYRVFDVLHQEYVGPEFPFRWIAECWLVFIGGRYANQDE